MGVLRSIGYPLEHDNKGGLVLRERAECVQQQIVSALETQPGERIMIPYYGMRQHIMNSLAPNIVVSDIESVVQKWVPQAREVQVTFDNDPDLFEEGRLNIEIRFKFEETEQNIAVQISDG